MTWEKFQVEYKRRLKSRWGITLTKPMCEKAFAPILSDLNDTFNLSRRKNMLHSFMVKKYGRPTQLTTTDGTVLSLK